MTTLLDNAIVPPAGSITSQALDARTWRRVRPVIWASGADITVSLEMSTTGLVRLRATNGNKAEAQRVTASLLSA